MSLRIIAKLFIDGIGPKLAEYVPVFHDFIKNDSLGEVLIDVADYSHVFEGPGIVLIGHSADYSLDVEKGRAGLRYLRKRAPQLANEEAEAKDALGRMLRAALLLEQDTRLSGLKFSTLELEVRFADRLHFPAESVGDAAARAVLVPALQVLFPGGFELLRKGTPKELLSFTVKPKTGETLTALSERLDPAPLS